MRKIISLYLISLALSAAALPYAGAADFTGELGSVFHFLRGTARDKAAGRSLTPGVVQLVAGGLSGKANVANGGRCLNA